MLAGYNLNPQQIWLQLQIQVNYNLGTNAVTYLFILGSSPLTNANSYLVLHLEGDEILLSSIVSLPKRPPSKDLPHSNKAKLLYHVNKFTSIYCLCISPSVAPNILPIVDREDHSGFFYCYKIIIYSWFIYTFVFFYLLLSSMLDFANKMSSALKFFSIN